MQSDTPVADSKESYKADHIALSHAKGHLLQDSYAKKGLGRRIFSPILWRLIVQIGDSMALIAFFVLLTEPALHLRLGLSRSIFGDWTANYLWICLAFIAWNLAMNISQAQKSHIAAHLLKSPLYAFCALLFTLIFPLFLFYCLIGNQVLAYVKSLLLFFGIAAPMLIGWRILLAEIMSLPRFRRQAVIAGVNAAGHDIVRECLSAHHPGINILGYININEHTNAVGELDGLPIFNGAASLRTLVQNGTIDLLIMATDYKANLTLFQEAIEAAQQGITLWPAAMVYENVSGKIPVEHIGDQWSMVLPEKQFSTLLYLCWRKLLDLTFGLCGLIALGITLPILAPLLYFDSPGPLFFKQERAGHRGRPFQILKLRTMSVGAEHAENGAWTAQNDARITRVGRVLRASHLDELPQALNVIRGEMSLIGPRPERPEYLAELTNNNPFYAYRLSVKPGLTGWAQVKYGYGAGEQGELVKLQYDLFYIKHRSFLLDLLIILKTVVEVILCHGI